MKDYLFYKTGFAGLSKGVQLYVGRLRYTAIDIVVLGNDATPNITGDKFR